MEVMWGRSPASRQLQEYRLLQIYSGVGLYHVCTLQLLEMVQIPSIDGLADQDDGDVLGDSY